MLNWWIPQTVATLPQRLEILELVLKRYPDVGRRIGLDQLQVGPQVASYSYMPLWSDDGSRAEEAVSRQQRCEFVRETARLLILVGVGLVELDHLDWAIVLSTH